MTEPPEIRHIDFSEFHPTGDHWPFTRYCRTYFGGGRLHLVYAWRYHWRDQILWPWHWLQCRRGRHAPVSGTRRPTPSDPWEAFTECVYCGAPQ